MYESLHIGPTKVAVSGTAPEAVETSRSGFIGAKGMVRNFDPIQTPFKGFGPIWLVPRHIGPNPLKGA